jgi:hypothetical protein
MVVRGEEEREKKRKGSRGTVVYNHGGRQEVRQAATGRRRGSEGVLSTGCKGEMMTVGIVDIVPVEEENQSWQCRGMV